MKRIVIGVIAVAGLITFAACGGGGPKCKKTTCSPVCDATKTPPQVCDTTSLTCVDYKTCSPTCSATQYCNNGTCADIPTTKTCSPACTGIQYCDTTAGTCKDVPVCTPVCDSTKGEYCTN